MCKHLIFHTIFSWTH